MKVLIDMNLSPDWVKLLGESQLESIHWSSVGNPDAPDVEIMSWARDNGYIVLTHDLDFGTILALTKASGPSVVQVRTEDLMSFDTSRSVIEVIRKNEEALAEGCLIVINESTERVRILPLRTS